MSWAENKDPEKKAGKLAALKAKFPDGKGGVLPKRKRVLYPSQLPPWVKDAIRIWVSNGITLAAIARKKGKSPETLRDWVNTPGAKKLAESWKVVIDDPVETVRLRARGDSSWVYEEMVTLYRVSKEAGDRNNARKILEYIGDVAAVKEVPTAATGAIVQINVQGGTGFSTEIQMGESEAVEVIEAEVVE